jgi:hypothetical protein
MSRDTARNVQQNLSLSGESQFNTYQRLPASSLVEQLGRERTSFVQNELSACQDPLNEVLMALNSYVLLIFLKIGVH